MLHIPEATPLELGPHPWKNVCPLSFSMPLYNKGKHSLFMQIGGKIWSLPTRLPKDFIFVRFFTKTFDTLSSP